jgi:hypothetical protein
MYYHVAKCIYTDGEKDGVRVGLTGLLSGSGFGVSRGALPNVFSEEPFLNKK